MSFLPHSAPRAVPWYGSFLASLTAHAGMVAFVVYSGVVVLVPTPEPEEPPEITVSLEILDANIVEELLPVDDRDLVPEDSIVTEPDALDAENPDELAALSPEDDALLAPDDESLIAPEDQALLEPEVDAAEPEILEPEPQEPEVLEPEPLEPEVSEPEVIEPEVTEPEVVEPEVTEPEVLEPEPIEPEVAEPEVLEPELAEVLPEPENEPLLVPEEVIEPEPAVQEPEVVAEAVSEPEPTPLPLPESEPESPLSIDDLSPIDGSVLNPLATGGSGPAPVEDDVLALLAPEPTLPEPPVVVPDGVEEVAPAVLPEEAPPEEALPEEEMIEEPVVAEPEPEPEPEPAPEPETAEEAPEPVAEEPPAEIQAPVSVPAASVRQPLSNPSAADVAIGQLLRRVRVTAQEQCTLALPRRTVGGSLAGLSMIGADEAVLDTVAERIISGLDFSPVETRELLDPRQCATLDALRQSDSYPANRIGLSLDTATLASGDLLTGSIVGAGGLFVTLLLIDDNGVVQNLAPFMRLDGNTPVFEAPVARSGPTRATRQILLSIGTAGIPLDLGDRIGQEAQDVFGSIPSDVLQNMVFGVVTFDVQ
jgi:hypothetical protein